MRSALIEDAARNAGCTIGFPLGAQRAALRSLRLAAAKTTQTLPHAQPIILAGAHVLHVRIGTQSCVVCQIPAGMIGVVVDNDVVTIPEPVADVVVVVGSHTKVEAPKLEPVSIPSVQAVNKTRANGAGEMSVRPGLVEMVVGIIPPGIVAHPAIGSCVNVRRIGMAGLLREITALVWLPLLWLAPGRAASAPRLGLLCILSLLPPGLSRTAIRGASRRSCATRRTGRRPTRWDVAAPDGGTSTLTAAALPATAGGLTAAPLLTAATGGLSTAALLPAAVWLGENWKRTQKHDSEKSRGFFHGSLL